MSSTPAGAPGITPRDLTFDVDPSRIGDWAGGDVARTTFFNAMSLLFPQGERFFIISVGEFRERITDPRQIEEVKAFVAQEALHTREHIAYNEALRGLVDVDRLDKKFADRIAFVRKWTPPLAHLAITCGLEHFTAILAHEVLERDFALGGAVPSYAQLWTWHALEECEHKAVAFDVFETVTSRKKEWMRRRIMMIVSFRFFRDIFINCYEIYKGLGIERSPKAWLALLWYLYGKPGVLRRIFIPYLKYFRRGFHPSQIDDSAERDRARSLIGAPA